MTCEPAGTEPKPSEAIERVARAILPVIQDHIIGVLGRQGMPVPTRIPFDLLAPEDREAMMNAARDAIAALKVAGG